MSRRGHSGHDFHFPGGFGCPVRNWPKNFNDFNEAFSPGQRPVQPCPGRNFDYFECFGYCV
jgi:hypothetical protein